MDDREKRRMEKMDRRGSRTPAEIELKYGKTILESAKKIKELEEELNKIKRILNV